MVQVNKNSVTTMIGIDHILIKQGKVGAYYLRNDDDWERLYKVVIIVGRRNEGGSVAGSMMPGELSLAWIRGIPP